jgi:hypothetical protein
MVIAVFTAPFSYFVDFLFNGILHAPTSDPNKVNHTRAIARTGRRLSAAIRRNSVAAVARGVSLIQAARRNGSSFVGKVRTGTTLVAPDATVEAYEAAATFVRPTLERMNSEVVSFEEQRMSLRQTSSTHRLSSLDRSSVVSHQDEENLPVEERVKAKYEAFEMDFEFHMATLDAYDKDEFRKIWRYVNIDNEVIVIVD